MQKESARIYGLDLARALAIIGMIAAHSGITHPVIRGVASGFPSALFAVLAGVSVGIISARGRILGGVPQLQMRLSLLTRGLLIAGIGFLLEAFPSYIVVVLGSIAAEIIILTLVINWRTRNLALLLIGLVFIGPAIAALAVLLGIYSGWLVGVYPLFAWLSYGLSGMIVHRIFIEQGSRKKWLLLGGITVVPTIFAFWYRIKGIHAQYGDESATYVADKSAAFSDGLLPEYEENFSFWRDYFSPMAHSGGLGDVVLSIAVALAVISLCVVICEPNLLRKVMYPLRAMGQMSLTSYTLHVIASGILAILVSFTNNDGSSLGATEMAPQAEETQYGRPWQEYQDLVNQAENWSDFYDLKYPPSPKPDTDYDTIDNGETFAWIEFAVQIVGISIFAMLWQLLPRFHRRGPWESFIRWATRKFSQVPPGKEPENYSI
ncbi:DUF418 domain-containing protein [Corynebacterium kutscheri]|uniref:DUF418 domain-containing protein n=1 Tax=Corynebacterium kutscheri TaxID=35755 RepID=UPI0037C11A26